MLNKNYDTGIIGLNYVSLSYGLISLKQNKSALIIEDKGLKFANKWYLNLGYLERTLLSKIGAKYDIEPLRHIDNYLTDKGTVICLNSKILEFTDSPYTNVKEFARKIPESFSDIYNSSIDNIDEAYFNENFYAFLDKVCDNAFSNIEENNLEKLFDENKVDELSFIKNSFLDFFETNTEVSKQIHYILQVMFQSVFSSAKLKIESVYLLLSFLSPRFEVNKAKLEEDLLFEFRKTGGDIKSTSVKDWGVQKGELKYILLNSVDGLIELESAHFFTQMSHSIPFKMHSAKTHFKSIHLNCVLEHRFINLYKNKRIIFSFSERMGSDFPYWEISIDNDGLLNCVYSYADYTGTKASFYYHHAVEDVYNSLLTILPGIDRAEWISRVKLQEGSDSWYEFLPKNKKKLIPTKNNTFSRVYDASSSKLIDRLYQYGPNSSKSLGFSSYMLDIFS